MKKLFALLLALMLVVPAFAMAENFPIVDEPITLTAFATAGPYTKGNFNDLAMWKAMEQLTNVKIDFNAAPSGQSAEPLGLLFASNTLPDVIFKTGLSNSDIAKYAEEGQLLPIDAYLEEYAPNFYGLMEEMPAIRNAITQANGHIYGFPYLVTCSSSNVVGKPFINAAFLQSIDAEMPATTDDLKELLVAFKESDWNGNGEADEIPMTCEGLETLITSLYGTFGLGTKGCVDIAWDIDPETGDLRYTPTSEGYYNLLAFLNELYTEGLFDEEIFDSSIAKVQAKSDQNQLFYCPATNSMYFTAYEKDFVGLEAPLTYNGSEPFWAGQNLAIAGQNTFFTSSCTEEELIAAIQYFDYFYCDEGRTLFFMGIENETFYYDEAGLPQFTDYVKANPDGMGMEEALGTYVCWSGGGNPSVADDLHFGNHLISAATMKAAQNMINYGPDEIWGSFTYTTEESERIAELATDINDYIKTSRAAFITGSTPLNEETWATYVAKIAEMGIDEYMGIQETAYQRYLDVIGE